MSIPGFTADFSCVTKSKQRIVMASSMVQPAMPVGGYHPSDCFPDCMDACLESEKPENCRKRCRNNCHRTPTIDNCRDEPDPNYPIAMGGILAWQIACYTETSPLTAAALALCALNQECNIIDFFSIHPCTTLANEMRKGYSPTQRVCDYH